jgi:hypothetical protein
MTEGNPGSAGWAAFEARMRERRFARCVERANAGLEAGTLEEVRDALDEARILCPDAPEIVELERRIAALPSPSAVVFSYDAPVQEPPAGWLRVAGAMCILVLLFGLFGFGLAQLYLSEPVRLLSLDLSKRSDAPELLEPPSASAAATGAAAETRAPAVSSPAPETAAPTTPTTAAPPATTRAAAGPTPIATAPAPAAPKRVPPSPSPIGTSSIPSRSMSAPVVRPETRTPAASTPAASAQRKVEPPAVSAQRNVEPPAVSARRDGESPAAAPPPPAPPPPAASEPPAVTAASRPAPVTDPVLPLGSPVLSPSAAAPRVVPAAMSREDESAQIRSVLSRYETAYNKLDAAAATNVYPGVDRAALDRAFKGLISQRVSLGLCDITVIGDVGGASCAGKARWEPRIGGGLQTADRYWTFNLRKGHEGWRIEQIRVR